MPPPTVEFHRRLRWADADAAGRLHFPRIFEIVEEAEGELLRAAGRPLDLRDRTYDFPRVHVECQFKRILELDAPYRLLFTVGRLGRTSIRYDYKVFDASERLAVEGTMTVVVMRQGSPVEILPPLRAALAGEA
jgi:acyl-CoA thioester hydrolase